MDRQRSTDRQESGITLTTSRIVCSARAYSAREYSAREPGGMPENAAAFCDRMESKEKQSGKPNLRDEPDF